MEEQEWTEELAAPLVMLGPAKTPQPAETLPPSSPIFIHLPSNSLPPITTILPSFSPFPPRLIVSSPTLFLMVATFAAIYVIAITVAQE